MISATGRDALRDISPNKATFFGAIRCRPFLLSGHTLISVGVSRYHLQNTIKNNSSMRGEKPSRNSATVVVLICLCLPSTFSSHSIPFSFPPVFFTKTPNASWAFERHPWWKERTPQKNLFALLKTLIFPHICFHLPLVWLHHSSSPKTGNRI